VRGYINAFAWRRAFEFEVHGIVGLFHGILG